MKYLTKAQKKRKDLLVLKGQRCSRQLGLISEWHRGGCLAFMIRNSTCLTRPHALPHFSIGRSFNSESSLTGG
jgi:hypothetical protein